MIRSIRTPDVGTDAVIRFDNSTEGQPFDWEVMMLGKKEEPEKTSWGRGLRKAGKSCTIWKESMSYPVFMTNKRRNFELL